MLEEIGALILNITGWMQEHSTKALICASANGTRPMIHGMPLSAMIAETPSSARSPAARQPFATHGR